MSRRKSAEQRRLEEYRERKSNWKFWGPYLSERAWGTVREDYSADGNAWTYFPHDHARSRAYRWGEDGLAGISDRNQYLCFCLSLWNGKDPILKERLFGLTMFEGNHGEDVKELYFYLDSTPTHSYMKYLYKYPQERFPYEQLREENARRGKGQREFEIADTKIFENGKYFDCFVEYAKGAENDIFIRITVRNCSSLEAELHVLPTIWFRNTWSWGYAKGPMGEITRQPELRLIPQPKGHVAIEAEHPALGNYVLYAKDAPLSYFTENNTNRERLFGVPNDSKYVKDGIEQAIVENKLQAVNPAQRGTKAAYHYQHTFAPYEEKEYYLRLTPEHSGRPLQDAEEVFALRRQEANEFAEAWQSPSMSEEEKVVQRQAIAGMLWSKQLYYYDVEQWIQGDPNGAPPPPNRRNGRNKDWAHLVNFDIISMPDKWEFPWYAAWDLAFHTIPLSLVDPDFAKRQLELMTREWYMHPNGQLPAYEWAFGDVNPPVHAWAAWRLYKIDAKRYGKPDIGFLEGIFHKMLLNFTWWVNRKDADGNNIFQGGFLGLDNIGLFDRSAPLPGGGRIDQADGTSWVAAFCLSMLRMSLELALHNPVYQDTASKFLEHFLRIANAMTNIGERHTSLWNEEDGFFYDVLKFPDGSEQPLKVRSLVGLLPIIAADTIEPNTLNQLPDFTRRLEWFVTNRQHLAGNMASLEIPGIGNRRLVSLLTRERLVRILKRLFDEKEFLSEFGIRSLSKFHEDNPFTLTLGQQTYSIRYEPGESTTSLFGGNSNWRGPVWVPINFILIEALRRFHHYYGDSFSLEYPTGSGKFSTLAEISSDLAQRLIKLFLKNTKGSAPCFGDVDLFEKDPRFQGLCLFHEYYNPETGEGLGASHQTGWTGLIAKLLQQSRSASGRGRSKETKPR